jgi:hypothetical protein
MRDVEGFGGFREFTVRIHRSMEPVLNLAYGHVAESQDEAGYPLSKRSPLAWGRVVELIFADWLSGQWRPIGGRNARVEAAAALILSLSGDELQMLKEKLVRQEAQGENHEMSNL